MVTSGAGAGTEITFTEKLLTLVTGFQTQWLNERSTVDPSDYILAKMKEVGEGKGFTKNNNGQDVLELLLYTPKNEAHRAQLEEENDADDIRASLTLSKEDLNFLKQSLGENKDILSKMISNYRDVDRAYWDEDGRMIEKVGKYDNEKVLNLGPLGNAPIIKKEYSEVMGPADQNRSDIRRKAQVEFDVDFTLRSLIGNEKSFFAALKDVVLEDNKVTEAEQNVVNYISSRVRNDDLNVAFDKDHINETIGELKAIIKNNAHIDAAMLDQAAKRTR